MKAVLIKNPNEIEIAEMPIPQIKKGEALLKIKYVGICGADVLSYLGKQPFTTYPRIPGHEFSAEIVEINADSTDLKVGMTVTANPYFNCGKCYSCKRGFVNCCEDNQTMGVQRDGAFCEYVAMPIQRIYDGKGLGADKLALIEPFSIGYHAANRADIKAGDNVLVVGGGPIGIFAMISAKLRGAKVYVSDVLQKRLDLAVSLGADGFINSANEDFMQKVKQITDGNGFDVAMEACGLPATFLNCIDAACFAGKVALIGNGKTETTFNHSILLKKELTVYGSRNSLNDFEPLIDAVNIGNVDIMKLVTNIYDLDNAKEAFDALVNNDGSLAKVLVKF